MNSIPELYSLQNSLSAGGIEGYHVQKKYVDPAKMKEERILSQSKEKAQSPRPVNISKKTTFIDDVQKGAAKLPGPTSYSTSILQKQRSKTSGIVKYPDRKTYFDQLQKQARKKNIPGTGTYKLEANVDKNKLKSNLTKAQSPTYAQACMRNSLDAPGVGQYNAYRAVLDHRGSKFNPDPQKNKDKKKSNVKFPPVGTYNPNPTSYQLFSSIQGSTRKSAGGLGGKSQRFKSKKQKTLPFYNILSQWGMKNKYKKKDILEQLSSHPASSRSVYY